MAGRSSHTYHMIIGTIVVLLLSVARYDAALTEAAAVRDSVHVDLISRVLQSSNTMVIPQPVTVNFGVVILRADLDTKENTLTAHCWFKYSWKDFRMEWTRPNSFNSTGLNLPTDRLWLPDITLYSKLSMDIEQTLTSLSEDGTVTWVPPAKIVVDCSKDGDTYTCPLKFGSWTYDSSRLDIQFYEDKEEVDLTYYNTRNRLEVVSSSGTRNARTYNCCPDKQYPDLTFDVVVRPIGDGLTSGGLAKHSPNYTLLILLAVVFYRFF